jgi:hypothetical protein
MNLYTLDRFSGLIVQPNSLTPAPGSFEIIENAIVSQDFLISKVAGLYEQYRFQSGQILNRIFDYGSFAFSLSQDTVYKLIQSSQAATSSCSTGSSTITITKTNHGIRNNDYISSIQIVNTDPFVSAFTNRHVDFDGLKQATVINANTFTIQANTPALSNVTSAVNAFTYINYTTITGPAFTITNRSRVLLSNQNAYFTTDDALMKIEGTSLPYLEAGIPPGLDILGFISRGLFDPGFGNYLGILLPKQSFAYRVLFGRKDANDNLILGAPSQFVVVGNNILVDIPDADIAFTSPTVTVTQIAHGYTSGQEIYIYDALTPSPAIPNGTKYTITVINSNTFSFDIGTATWTAPRSLSYGVPVTPGIQFSIPSQINDTSYIYQIYRSSVSNNNTVPQGDYKLLAEANLDNVQLTAEFVEYNDTTTELLIASNAQLYTNNTQEGSLQENSRPPKSTDIALFRNYAFYSNTTQYGRLELALDAPNNLVNGDIITIANTILEFRGNALNEPVGNDRVRSSCADDGAGGLVVTQVNHGFVLGDVVFVLFNNGLTGLPFGFYTVYGPITANTFKIGSGVSGTGSVTYNGVFSSVTGRRLVKLFNSTAPDSSIAIATDQTARFIVEAINRNPSSTVYAQYTSTLSGSPGKMTFESKTFSGGIFSATAGIVLAGNAFTPTLPVSGTSVSSTQDKLRNQISVSKINEPEAVPLTNTFLVGTREAAILRILPLRDSLIILKEDGVFRLNGLTPNDFSVTLLDSTVFCRASESATVLSNSVYSFTNQGVVQISDSNVRILSRPIEPYLTTFNNNTVIESLASGVAYESERLYMLSILAPNSDGTIADITYVYNYLNDSWSTISQVNNIFSTGTVSTLNDNLYGVPSVRKNSITRERKDHTKIDNSVDAYPCQTFISIPANLMLIAGSNIVQVKFKQAHRLILSQTVTLSKATSGTIASFSGGASDIEGLRTIVSIDDQFTISIQVGSNSIFNLMDTIFIKEGVSEYTSTASSLLGSRTVNVTTAQPHGLTSGQSINVNSASSNLISAFGVVINITGIKNITVLSPNSFLFITSVAASSTVTGTIQISDLTQDLLNVSINMQPNVIPSAGDAIVLGNDIFKTDSVIKYAGTLFLIQLTSPYQGSSISDTFIYGGFLSRIKLNPVTIGNPGLLKFVPEFQSTFRNQSSCSALEVNFTTDAFPGTETTFWNTKVGSTKTPIVFGGFGQQPWGAFPWGGGVTIERDFVTGSSVLMRIYIPKETFCCVYIQPILNHRVACEPLELQSMTFSNQLVSSRTSK